MRSPNAADVHGLRNPTGILDIPSALAGQSRAIFWRSAASRNCDRKSAAPWRSFGFSNQPIEVTDEMSFLSRRWRNPATHFLHGKCQENPCALCSAAAYCCGAVALRVTAALLGRFLPRLGPLVFTSGPFFVATFADAVGSACRSNQDAGSLIPRRPEKVRDRRAARWPGRRRGLRGRRRPA